MSDGHLVSIQMSGWVKIPPLGVFNSKGDEIGFLSLSG